ncbi:MAG: 50S ribosomal protein L28 [Chloroflexi bacterium]|nr:50S ribosomal protein L28 [Chloroflexota bacterium]MBI3732176.1 50S ribosomal protein L28 [Chloroflexota bacterium]
MAKCYVCGRGAQFGHNVSHAFNRTNRRFDVNIQRTTVNQDGKSKKVPICTRCLRNRTKVKI